MRKGESLRNGHFLTISDKARQFLDSGLEPFWDNLLKCHSIVAAPENGMCLAKFQFKPLAKHRFREAARVFDLLAGSWRFSMAHRVMQGKNPASGGKEKNLKKESWHAQKITGLYFIASYGSRSFRLLVRRCGRRRSLRRVQSQRKRLQNPEPHCQRKSAG
jgi:hypothetical protein